MNELLEILEKVRPDVDFNAENELITGGILDSFDIITIVNELNEAYSIDISITELTPDNFNSAESIQKLIERLR